MRALSTHFVACIGLCQIAAVLYLMELFVLSNLEAVSTLYLLLLAVGILGILRPVERPTFVGLGCVVLGCIGSVIWMSTTARDEISFLTLLVPIALNLGILFAGNLTLLRNLDVPLIWRRHEDRTTGFNLDVLEKWRFAAWMALLIRPTVLWFLFAFVSIVLFLVRSDGESTGFMGLDPVSVIAATALVPSVFVMGWILSADKKTLTLMSTRLRPWPLGTLSSTICLALIFASDFLQVRGLGNGFALLWITRTLIVAMLLASLIRINAWASAGPPEATYSPPPPPYRIERVLLQGILLACCVLLFSMVFAMLV